MILSRREKRKRDKLRRNLECECGSGEKWKNCHGKKDSFSKPDRLQPIKSKPATSANVSLMGVPGEMQNLVTINVRKGESPDKLNPKPWRPGEYRVQLMLGRQGYPMKAEYSHSFIGSNVGNSHLMIIKPVSDRKDSDPDRMIWWAVYVDKTGKRTDIQFLGEANTKGFLAKFSATVNSSDGNQAASTAFASLAPLLSGLSANTDVPLFIESIDVVHVETGNGMLRIVAPFPEQSFNFGPLPHMSDEYCHYASLYREALQSNSPFYRFLCLFKIVEGLLKRRGRLTVEAKKTGDYAPRRSLIPERIPSTREQQLRLLKAVYSTRTDAPWDELFLGQTFPAESHDKSIQQIKSDILEEVRKSIAHALLEDGEPGLSTDDLEDHWKVNKWLPLLRFIVRVMLTNDFSVEFQLGSKINYSVEP